MFIRRKGRYDPCLWQPVQAYYIYICSFGRHIYSKQLSSSEIRDSFIKGSGVWTHNLWSFAWNLSTNYFFQLNELRFPCAVCHRFPVQDCRDVKLPCFYLEMVLFFFPFSPPYWSSHTSQINQTVMYDSGKTAKCTRFESIVTDSR